MLIGASLVLFGAVLLVMTHDLREEPAWPDEGVATSRTRVMGFWWTGVALVAVGLVLAVASFLVL